MNSIFGRKMMVSKVVTMLLLLLLFTCPSNAQTQIGSFYGVKLGMTVSEVKSAISRQGKTLTQSSRNPNFYSLKSPAVGDFTFDEAFFEFKNSKLYRGGFLSRDGAGGMPSAAQFNVVERKASNYKKIFNAMRANLISKYGEPMMDDGNEVIWQKGGNKLTLSYDYTDETGNDFWRKSNTYVSMEYVNIGSNSSNY